MKTVHSHSHSRSAGLAPVASAVIVAAVAALVFLGWLLYHTLASKPDGTYRPQGYYERVDKLIGGGALVYQAPAAADARSGRRNQPQWGKIAFGEAASREPHRSFLAESRRTRMEVEQFNEDGPGGLFAIAGGKLRFNPYAHNLTLPYPERGRWSGSLSFRGEELPTLAGENVMLAFVGTREDRETAAREHEILAESQWLGAEKQRAWRAKAFDLLGGGAGEGALVRLHVRGEVVFLEVPEGPHKGLISLNGVRLNAGEVEGITELRARSKENRPNLYALQSGDRVRVVSGDKEGIFRFGKLAGGMISRSWLEEGRKINEVDPQLARDIPYVRQLHESLQAFVAGHPDPGSLRQPNVRLTLDRQLHLALTAELESFLTAFDRGRALVPEVERQPACIATLNALTGDVLALPSYPSPQKLEQLIELAEAGRIKRLARTERFRLEKNQNLVPVPIGSTNKPLLACAIWNAYPALRKLVVDEPAGGMMVASGLNLGKPVATIGPRVVNAVDFLGKSSNAYTVSLYLATLADPGSWRLDAAGRFQPAREGGKVDFSHFVKSGIIAGGLGYRQHLGNDTLGALFDITLRGDLAGGDTADLDPALLEPMFKAMGVPDGPVDRAFRTVSSTRPNLALQEVDTVRGELVSLLVGGYTNRWPNVKLAEAYARIGTGRRVQMRVSLPGEEKKAPSFAKLDIDTAVLAMVHQGMEAAVTTGTARNLQPAIRKEQPRFAREGLELRVIGKTGTARRLEKSECAAFCLYAEILPKNGSKPLAATSTAIYLQDRAAAKGIRNSAVAVELAARLLPHLSAWMEDQPEVRKWLEK